MIKIIPSEVCVWVFLVQNYTDQVAGMESDAVYDEVHEADVKVLEIKQKQNDCYECVKNSSAKCEGPTSGSKKIMVVLGLAFVTLILLLGAVAAIAIHTLMEVSMLKFNIASSEHQAEQTAAALQQNDSALNIRLESLISFSNTAHHRLNNSIAIVKNLLLSYPSCNALPSSFPAGYYYILSSSGSAVRQYCPSLTTRCEQTGRWRSLANLDMTNSTHQCFSDLRQHTYSNKTLCVKRSDFQGCSSVQLPATTAYRSVCGLVKAYQFGTPDAFSTSTSLIDSHYVDGVSITHGTPRQHIWTFAAATNENSEDHGCSCVGGNNSDRPAFVGNDYFCDTVSTSTDRFVFYGDDPLWDGSGCGPTNGCCSFNTPPWFYKELPRDTTDDMELRVCRNQGRSDEDVAIEAVIVYVK